MATTLEILEKLLGFETTSCESNLALMEYVQSYLGQYDVESQLIFDESGQKANLYATFGPGEKPGVMLSGHTDTVPVKGQNWTVEPFAMTLKDGLCYGRGSTDMKGFIAAVLAKVPEMAQAPLHTPIHLAFSYDEEIGCIGVRRLIDTLAGLPIKPAICIIGEPTTMKVVSAHKGKLAAKVTVTGKECHSGMAPMGVNAVNYAARLINFLEQMAEQKRQSGPFEEGYEIPYSTVHTGVVKGGSALNIVPNHCEFIFEIRNVACEDPKALLGEFEAYAQQLVGQMRERHADCDIRIDITTEYPGLSTADDSAAIEFVKQLAQPISPQHINFGTEGGLFSQRLGVSTVVCGPGDMAQGHKPDEFISLSQLSDCEDFLSRLIARLSETEQ